MSAPDLSERYESGKKFAAIKTLNVRWDRSLQITRNFCAYSTIKLIGFSKGISQRFATTSLRLTSKTLYKVAK